MTNIFDLHPERKFNYCIDAAAKCLAVDGINSVIHSPLEGTHNIDLEWKTKWRTHDSVTFRVLLWPSLTTLCSRRSSSSDTELLNWDANEHICWQRLRSSNNAASRFKASAVLVRKLSKWMILLQRKVTWKWKQECEKLFQLKRLLHKLHLFHVFQRENFKSRSKAALFQQHYHSRVSQPCSSSPRDYSHCFSSGTPRSI